MTFGHSPLSHLLNHSKVSIRNTFCMLGPAARIPVMTSKLIVMIF